LITDSGAYDPKSHVVASLGSKCAVAAQGVAISAVGGLHITHLARGMVAHEHLSQAELIEELPNIARAAVEKYNIGRQSCVVFAGYSQELGRAFGGAFVTHATEPGFVPYQILRRTGLFLPPLPLVDVEAVLDPSRFNPYVHSMPLIEQQRRHNYGTPEEPFYGVAGDIDVAAVSRTGTRVHTIHTYPAEVGHKVSVERTDLDAYAVS